MHVCVYIRMLIDFGTGMHRYLVCLCCWLCLYAFSPTMNLFRGLNANKRLCMYIFHYPCMHAHVCVCLDVCACNQMYIVACVSV